MEQEIINCAFCGREIKKYLAYRITRKHYKHTTVCFICKRMHDKKAIFNPETKTWRGVRKSDLYTLALKTN